MAKLKTGVGIAGLSGTSGGAVFVERRDGSVLLRERPVQRGQATEAQSEAKRLFQSAARSWSGLTAQEQRAWLAWARQADPFAGAPGAANAYVSLTVRWLAANAPAEWLLPQSPPHLTGHEEARSEGRGGSGATTPSLRGQGAGSGPSSRPIQSGVEPPHSGGAMLEPPRLPPASPFGGDAVAVTVAALPEALRYAADRANAEGVVTELMAARVRSALAEPRDRDYRILGRARFVEGGLDVDVPVPPGRYAVAVRFVKIATGQASAVLRLGTASVGG
ncbi:MAG: hypothetical protein KIT11_09920 [Fimbriimonadaceae bacterium]|nr:hypothetical protein [Fimbriimonadaceae bacterium]QYK55641.1 MAG: hypothetical protein KF733_11590 [Fimbriimonadaceae bacterium]